MVYMSISLAVTAGGILLCYLLLNGPATVGKTLNGRPGGQVFGGWHIGPALALITIFSEGALLFVAARRDLSTGPGFMANMAVDYWFPHRFASLSDRFTHPERRTAHGRRRPFCSSSILAASIATLIVMYSINVFLTFSLSELGMSRFFYQEPEDRRQNGKKHLPRPPPLSPLRWRRCVDGQVLFLFCLGSSFLINTHPIAIDNG